MLYGMPIVVVALMAAAYLLVTADDVSHAQTSTPAKPTGLTASPVAHDSVTLNWDEPEDSSITGYQVLRRSRDGDEYGDGQGGAEFVAVVGDTGSSATTYTDTSVTPRTRYVYRVKAINSAGTSGRSRYLNVETSEAPAPSAPVDPTGLTVSSVTHDSVTLTWDDPGDDSITGYQVLRRPLDLDGYGDGLGAAEFVAVVDDTGASVATHTDTSVAARTRYVYRVKARNAQGLGGASNDADAETAEDPDSQRVQPCQEGYVVPTPTEVPVTAVPIVVESTTSDYFVLYASHDLDGETVWYPVKVVLGEDGTTTLSENVAALPVERYRVEKYLIANPADVDGDCVGDITELANAASMNPVNPANDQGLPDRFLIIPDHQTYERLALVGYSGLGDLKFVISNIGADRPSVFFQNTKRFKYHTLLSELGDAPVRGSIIYDPDLVAPDGSGGMYRYTVQGRASVGLWDRVHTLLAASMPVLDDDLALWVINRKLPQIQAELQSGVTFRANLVFDEDVHGDTGFLALNPGEGYGLLRSLEDDERPHSRDVGIYETLPNELPRVAGIISTVPQTPLSHVNLRALQDGVPNAFIRDALEDDDISDLIGSHVYYAVGDTGYTILGATQAEVDDFYASSRPTEAQTPQRDLTVTSITALGEVRFEDWDSFGVKAANVAVLGTLRFPAGTVPDGFAVPFYFYDEFMKHNGLYEDIEEMLADSDFQTDYDTKEDELKKLRKKIKKAETPEWIETALTEMHATFPEGTSLRYRSSTNNEDLPNFNGAGLYDSKTQHPEETEEDGISKSLKQVYASMWNFRAFIERDFHRVDHLAAAMGVLVHPNYSDEPVNGVAVSVDPAYGTEGTYYVNSQRGEDLITNPEAHSEPEELLLYPDGSYTVVALSNQVPPGQLLMTDDQLAQLRRRLAAIHERFADLYAVEEGEQFAMEVEFKITSDSILAIKQARPWVFSDAPRDLGAKGVALTAALEDAPASHDGNLFTFRIRFSDNINIGFQEFEDFALAATGGWVTRANRVKGRSDYWEIDVAPDRSFGDITLVLAHNRHCPVVGAICTLDGQRLSNRLEHTVLGPPPPVPDRPTGRAPSSDSVQLEWKHVPRAESYEVQFRHTGQWLDLPANGVEIEFDGDEAVVKRLPTAAAYSFRVRAVNSHGASEWSLLLFMPNRLDLESELTAGRETDVSPVRSGYGRFGDLGGTLSPVEFLLDGTTYRVQYLVHSRESLWLGTSPALPADFTLLVGDSVYRGSESMASDTPIADAGYWWPSTTPDWSADGPVRVGLLVHPDGPLGDRQKVPVSGEFRSFPSEHDGHEDFSFRIYFSEGIPTTADALRDHVLSVSGGTVSGVKAIVSEGRIWAVTVTPEGRHPVMVRIEADLDCQSSAAICTADGRRLFNRMKLTVNAIKNNPATGPPIIRGVGGLGARLRASLADLDDADGLSGATFRYQWLADGTDIQGATDSIYVLDADNAGKSIRVRVSFTDDEGYEEALTSEPAPAAPNSPATGTPAIIGTAQVGQILTADTSSITDADGLNNPGYSYQWVWNDGIADSDIAGATGRTYILLPKDEGKTILVRVSLTDDVGNAETRSSVATPRVGHAEDVIVWKTEITSGQNMNVFPLESGYSALEGLGETLSPDSFEIDGTTYRVRSLVHSSGSLRLGMDRELPADFTLVVGDSVYRGSESMMVPPSAEGEGYWWPSATPDWLGDDPVRVGLIVYSGIPLGDRQKAPVTGYFQDYPSEHDGNTYISFHIHFSEGIATAAGALRDHILSVSGGSVSGVDAVGSEGRTWAVSVTPGSHDPVTIRIEADLDCQSSAAVCTSDGRRLFNRMELTVEPRERHPATGAPTIGGTVEPGQTLTADTSGIADAHGLTGATFTYQWVSYDGNSYTDVQGATDSAYTLVQTDEGRAFKVRVSFTDDAGNRQSLTSPLARSDRPYGLKASESDGAVVLTWKLPVGWTGSTFWILRNRPELGETEPLVLVRFTESGMTTYTDTDVEPGGLYVYRVKGVDPFGYTGEASHPFEIRTAGPAPVENSPATGAPVISGTAQVGETLTVDTSGIADADGLTGAAFGYQWLEDDSDISGATGPSYTLTAADVGKTIRVRVSFTDDAGNAESLTSAATGTAEPAAPPAPQDLTAVVNQDGSITLTWTAPDDDSITGYQVLRRRPSRDETTLVVYLEDTGSTGTTYTDTDTPNGDTYVYRVKAINPAGTGERSNYVRIVRSNE